MSFVTFDQALTDLLRGFWAATGVRPDLDPYSSTLAILESNAYILEQQSFDFQTALADAIVTSTASAIGLTLGEAKNATGSVIFSRATIAPFDILIPAGTRVQTPSGVRYQTVSNVTLLLGTTSIAADIETIDASGKSGNTLANTITEFVDIISGVETVTNPGQLSNGQDAETADQLASRVALELAKLAKGTKAAVEAVALTTASPTGEIAAKAYASDPFTDVAIPLGVVRVYLYRPTGTSLSLRQAVLAVLEAEQRPIGISIEVLDVARPPISIAYTVVGTNSLITTRLQNAVQEFFNALEIGEDFIVNRLEAHLARVDPSIYSVTVTTPAANVVVPRYERAELNGTPVLTFTLGGAT